LQSPITLNILNQCQDIALTSPAYFLYGGNWHVVPDQEIGVNTVMRNLLKLDSGQSTLEGTLVYKIQRKHTKYEEFIQDESKHIQLLVSWRGEHAKGLHVYALLVEHDKEFDEDKLRMLHQKCWHLLRTRADPIGSNWLLNDMTVLATTIKVMNEGYRWDIFISEGIKNNVRRPLWIDIER
jgi:hypothetical protein